MRSLIRILQSSAVLACALTLFSPQVNATRVKQGSSYGESDAFGNSLSGVTDCETTDNSDNGCQAYVLLGSTTLDGISATEYEFSDGSDPGVIFDIFNLGSSLTNGTTVSLSGAQLGIFTCGDFTGNPSPSDFNSSGPAMGQTGLPCTPIGALTASPNGGYTVLDFTEFNGSLPAGFEFTLNADGSITFNNIPNGDDVVVYDAAATPTPEPSTLGLLGLGIVALGGLLLRRTV